MQDIKLLVFPYVEIQVIRVKEMFTNTIFCVCRNNFDEIGTRGCREVSCGTSSTAAWRGENKSLLRNIYRKLLGINAFLFLSRTCTAALVTENPSIAENF